MGTSEKTKTDSVEKTGDAGKITEAIERLRSIESDVKQDGKVSPKSASALKAVASMLSGMAGGEDMKKSDGAEESEDAEPSNDASSDASADFDAAIAAAEGTVQDFGTGADGGESSGSDDSSQSDEGGGDGVAKSDASTAWPLDLNSPPE